MARAEGFFKFFRGRQGVVAAAVIAVPVLYFLGFLAWAWFAVWYGLGFLPLTASQLMAAGMVVLVLVSLPLLADTLLLKLVDGLKDKPATKKNRRKVFWLHFLCRIVAFWAAYGLLAGIQGMAPFLRMNHPWELPVYFLFAGVMAALLHLHGWHMARKAGHLNPRRKKLGKTPAEVRLITRLGAALVMYVVFLVALFPAMRAEYHGPEPRRATLDIDQGQLSRETKARLWPTWSPGSAEVVRTPEVRVVFVGEHVVMLRSICEDERSGALFTVDREHVPAIVWTGSKPKDDSFCPPKT